jgi:hypothetical protein
MPSRAKGFTRLAVPSLAVLVTAGTLSWPSAAQAQTPGLTEGQLYALLSQAQQSATTSADETPSPDPQQSTEESTDPSTEPSTEPAAPAEPPPADVPSDETTAPSSSEPSVEPSEGAATGTQEPSDVTAPTPEVTEAPDPGQTDGAGRAVPPQRAVPPRSLRSASVRTARPPARSPGLPSRRRWATSIPASSRTSRSTSS